CTLESNFGTAREHEEIIRFTRKMGDFGSTYYREWVVAFRSTTSDEARGLQQLDSAQVKVEVFGTKVELRADVADRAFDFHQRLSYRLRLRCGQRPFVHAANGLALHQFPDELHEGQHELDHRSLD